MLALDKQNGAEFSDRRCHSLRFLFLYLLQKVKQGSIMPVK